MIEKKIICKSLDEAFAEIKSYFEIYCPAGYDTDAFISIGFEGVEVKFTRLDSCD